MKKVCRCWLVMLLSLVLVLAVVQTVGATEENTIQCTDLSQVVCVLRERLQQRQEVICLSVPYDAEEQSLSAQIMNEALVHTGVSDEGDYLRWSIRKCTAGQEILEQDGQRMLVLTYTTTYYTTLEQENQLAAAIPELLDQLNVYDAQPYEKVCAIYDYICQNIVYDNLGAMLGDKLVYSAYAALVQKRAVCQGYATLFYRLALELGLDTRLIAGTSKNASHGWNIVRLDGKFYNVDPTWDAQNIHANKRYEYFLKGTTNFTNHTAKATYTAEDFLHVYYMSETDYSPDQRTLGGDLTEDGRVDVDDAICLLQNVLMPELFPIQQAVDYTRNSIVNVDDAIYLLQHVLMLVPLKKLLSLTVAV